MERSLSILVMIMRHRAPMRLLVTTNVEEITVILHRYNNAAQYLIGEASCFTFEQNLLSLRSIDPRHSLRIFNYSNDILPSQVT